MAKIIYFLNPTNFIFQPIQANNEYAENLKDISTSQDEIPKKISHDHIWVAVNQYLDDAGRTGNIRTHDFFREIKQACG